MIGPVRSQTDSRDSPVGPFLFPALSVAEASDGFAPRAMRQGIQPSVGTVASRSDPYDPYDPKAIDREIQIALEAVALLASGSGSTASERPPS